MKKLAINISNNLKLLRQKKGWSLDIASKKTGVSKAMLGQIERSESSPTIETLWKIANGFKTSFSSFIEENSISKKTAVQHTSKLRRIISKDDKIRVIPIFSYDEKLFFEVFLIELLPGCEHLSRPHKGGIVEHVIAAEGQIEVFANGIWHKLKKNEGLRFDANQKHGYRNKSNKKATFYDVIHYPVI